MKTRLAPSPTGYLHLGHAYSALMTKAFADHLGMELILRLENIDHTRCRHEYETAVEEDLTALGIRPSGLVIHQSDRFPRYAKAIQKLQKMGVLFPCTCTRADLENAPKTPDGTPLYPGTCRQKTLDDIQGEPYALRLNMTHAIDLLKKQGNWPLTFEEATKGHVTATPEKLGDVVIARKEFPTSYHLAVVCDDAAQDITNIIRGADLFEMTHVHRLLQALLELPTPHYRHHGLLMGADQNKLSKSAASTPLRELPKMGVQLEELHAMFQRVWHPNREPGAAFIRQLPEQLRDGLTFEPFR